MNIDYYKMSGVLLLILLAGFGSAAPTYAHGVIINYTVKTNGEVELYGEFDTGEAMSEAQVTIYSPVDPLTPWLTGTADKDGNYVFVIDPEILGTWDVQFRKAGHGDIIHFQLEAVMIDPALVTHPPGELTTITPSAQTESNTTKSSPSTQTTAVSSGGNTATGSGFSSLQILLMSASVIWGFVGTALYFSSKKNQEHNHAHGHHH